MAGTPFQLPQYAGDYQNLSRQQAIAGALLQNSLTPADNTSYGAGTFVPKYTVGQGLTKLASALLGKQISNEANSGLNQLGGQQWGAMSSMMGGGQPYQQQATAPAPPVDPQSARIAAMNYSGTNAPMGSDNQNTGSVGPTNANADLGQQIQQQAQQAAPQQQQPQQQSGSGMNPAGLPPMQAAMMYMQDPAGYIKDFVAPFHAPTEFTKTLLNAGIDPTTPLGKQLIQSNLAKQNYIAPVSGSPGTYQRDPITGKVTAFNAAVPEGTTPVFDASGNVVGTRPIQGAIQYAADKAGAVAGAQAQHEPISGFDAQGNPVFTNKENASQGGSQAPVGNFSGDYTKMSAQIAQIKDPTTRAQAQAALDSQMGAGGQSSQGNVVRPALAPGKEKSIAGNVANMTSHYDAMTNSAQTIPSQVSALDNIVKLAPTAITGAGTGWRDILNGALAFSGIQSSGDAKTDTDLLKKNSAFLAMAGRLGSGGTDAAQTLMQAATPNNHMSVNAIKDAANYLKGGLQMQQSELQYLQPYRLNNDERGYANARLTFEKNADPRLWALQNMSPQDGAKYIQSLPADQRTDLQRRAQSMKQIGAF